MTVISRIFLDANVLDQGWPVLSGKVLNLFEIVQKLGIQIEVPHPVMLELQRRWNARITGELKSTADFLKHLRRLGQNTSEIASFPSIEAIQGAYESTVKALCGKWSIHITAMPTIPLMNLFVQATEQHVVFGEKGVNFQDAVIFHSAIERLVENNEHGALISEDAIFSKRKTKLDQYANGRATVTCFNLHQARTHFTKLLSDSDQSRIAHHDALARSAISLYLPKIEDQFNEHLKEHPYIAYGRHGDPRSLRNAVLERVTEVALDHSLSDLRVGSELTMYVMVRGAVEATTTYTRSNDVRTFTKRVSLDLNFSASATFNGDSYSIGGIDSMNYTFPNE